MKDAFVAEFGLADKETNKRVDRYFRLVRDSFLHALENARDRGEIDAEELEPIAEQLTATVVGVSVVADHSANRGASSPHSRWPKLM